MPSRGRLIVRSAAVIFLVAGILLLILLATPWPSNLLRTELLRRAEALSGGRLEIASLELRFFPPRVIARGVRYEQGEGAGGGIRIACGEADLSVPYGVYRGRFDRIDSLRLDHPEIVIQRGTGTVAPPPAPGGGSQGEGRVPSLGSLTVVGGSVRIRDPAAGWEASLESVNLSGAGEPSGLLAGRLEGSLWSVRKGEFQSTGRLDGDYRLGGRRIEIPRFRVNTEADPLHGSGSVELDLAGNRPRFHLTGEVSLEKGGARSEYLGDLAGRARLDLRGEEREDGLHLAASVAAPEVSYQGWGAGEISLELLHRPGELEVTRLNAKTLGGILSGQAALRWQEGAFSSARLEGRAALREVSVEEISRQMGLPEPPLIGRIDHTGEFRMEGFDLATLDARGSATFSGRLRAGTGEAVTGSGRFHMLGTTLEVTEASLKSEAASARFRGKLQLAGERSIDGDLLAESARLDLLAPFIAGIPSGPRAPLTEILRDSRGANLEVSGHLTKNRGGVRVDGRAEARSLALRGSHLGDLELEFSASPSRVEVKQATLHGGAPALDVSGWFRPGSTSEGGGPAFSLKGRAEGVDLSWIGDWLESPVPLGGLAAATFDLSSETGAVLGTADWKVDRPVLASLPMESAGGRIALAPEGIRLEEFRLSREGGSLEASGSIGYRAASGLVYVTGKGIRLEWLRESGLVPADVRGEVRIQAQMAGSLESPTLEMDLETPGWTVKGVDMGALAVRVDADRQRGAFQVCPEAAGIAMTGEILWKDDLPFRADLEAADFRVSASQLGAEFSGTDGEAVFQGSLHASGALKDRSRLDATGTLQSVKVKVGGNEIVSSAPAAFHWKAPRLELTPFHLVGPGTDVTLSGQLNPEGGDYRFTADGKMALATLGPFLPGVILGGTGTFSFTWSGSETGPRQEGWVSVQEGRIQAATFPLAVSSLQGRLVLDPPGNFHLEGVTLVAGGGKVSLEGKGSLQGIRPTELEISLSGREVLILAPEGFRGRYDMNLKLTQGAEQRLLAGTIHLIRGVYDRDFRLERNLLSLARESPASVEEEEPSQAAGFLAALNLDLALEANRGLWIINDFATLEGSASFHVGGTAARPEIKGRFSALEGGTIRFRQVRYRVDRGNIDLVDVARFNPSLDLSAETNVSDYQVYLKIQGELDDFTYELTSSPPLTQPEILALLVSGRSPDTALETSRMAHDAATSYLTSGLATGLGGALEGMTGMDQFSIDPVYLTSQGDPASRVTVGKQITENLFAAYSTLIGSSSEEMYQLEYRMSRDFKFTSTREEDGAIGGDLRYLLRQSTAPRSEPAALKSEGTTISAVRLEGNPGMSEEKLRHFLRVEPGEKLDRSRLAARVEKLLKKYHRKDHWQATVETREEPVEGDPAKVEVALKVDAGPVVRIHLEGVPSRGKRRKEMETLWSNSIFHEETPQEARAKLERRLHEEGYSHARVEARLVRDTPEIREVILEADAGPEVRVKQVVISGNESFETARLESLLKTKPGRHVLKPEQVNTDAGRIRAHYIAAGYAQVRVSPPETTFTDDPAAAVVRFQVVEGSPTKVAEIRIEGNQALASGTLLKGLSVRPTEPFTREKARSGAEEIRRAYDRAGYTGAKVSYELRGDSEKGPLLLYRVEEGPKRLVGKIEIEGNRLTRKELVEKELTFQEGTPLSTEAIVESQRALYRLGIFSFVEIREVPGEDPSRPTVRILVAESKNLTQSLGIGYATDEGVRALYDVTNANLMGRARSIGFQIRGSDVNHRIQFLLRDPYLFNRRLDSLMTVFHTREVHDGFTLTERGTTLQVSNKHGEKNRTIYRYTLKDDDVTDLEITPLEAGVESLRLSGFSGGFVHDSRDNFYNPRKGRFAMVDLAAYGERIGSEAAYLKFFTQGSVFRLLPGDSVWAQSIRVGLAYPFGISDSVPLSERFYAGGDTTVRGFDFEELGPKDPLTGEPVGGESLFIVNEEYRFPIWGFLRGVVFFDAGNVTSTLSDFNPMDLRTVLGAGFRIDTPIGPFRVEYGWKLDREAGESPGELHITIGQAF